MLPDGVLSTTAVRAGFNYPVKTAVPADKLQDWELAGVAINDPSEGLEVKLWHGTLEIDKATGVGSVYLEAPGVAKTLLFTGADITEIAIAFDQNMNPFVAYMQGGAAKFYWYDTTIAMMTHTTLPDGCYDLRCCLDEKRSQNNANSDILLSYIRGGNLCIRYQRERYLNEYVLKAGAGSDANLVSMAMNKQFRIQWRIRNYELTDDPGALLQAEPYLGDVVEDFCRRAGLPAESIDVSELYPDIVPGIKVSVAEGLDKPIDWLREIYQFDKSQHGKKIHFPRRGRPITFRIPYEHLIVTGVDQALAQEIVDEKKLPRKVSINHIDSTGGFAKNKQTASRRSNLITTDEEMTIESGVVLTPDQAANAALVILKTKHAEQYQYKFSTSIRYTEITPGDVGEVEDELGVWHRVRMEEKNEDAKIIEWDAIQDGGSLAYAGINPAGQVLDTPVSTTPGLVGDTTLEILNLPVQRDQDDELGLYIAARGTGTGWSGYVLYYSIDLGLSYLEGYQSSQSSNIGETTLSMSDSDTTVEVLMPDPLESVSDAQLAAGYNRAVIGDEEVQYKTATLLGMVGDLYHYAVSGIVRGAMHTLAEPWAAGIRFVTIDTSVLFLQLQRQFYGIDIYYKAVSFGQSVDEVAAVAYLFDHAANQTEWQVSSFQAMQDDSPDAKISWAPSPRLGTFGAYPFHSKYFTGYHLTSSDGLDVMLPPDATEYAYVGHLPATVTIASVNSITGEGVAQTVGLTQQIVELDRLHPSVAVTRSTTATYMGATGLLMTAAVDEPRYEYDSAGNYLGLLIEESRTNICHNSEDLTAANWLLTTGGTGTLPVVTSNYAVAPDGATTADRVQLNCGGGGTSTDVSQLSAGNTASTASVNHVTSVWMKTNDGSTVTVGLVGVNGIVLPITVTSAWQRFDRIGQIASTNPAPLRIRLRGNEGTSTSADLSIWGGQCEKGDFVTSYIPTAAVDVTRAIDTVQVSALASIGYNAAAGAMFVEFIRQPGFTTTEGIFTFYTDSNNYIGVGINSSGIVTPNVVVSGTTQVSLSPGVAADGALSRIAVAWAANDFGASLNGAAASTDNSGTIPTVATLALGTSVNASGRRLNGHIKRMWYSPHRVNDADLKAMTT